MHIDSFERYEDAKDKYYVIIQGFNENEDDCSMVILYDANNNEFGFAWNLFEEQGINKDEYFKKISYRFKFESYKDTILALDEKCILYQCDNDDYEFGVEYLYDEYINRIQPWLSKDDNKELKKAYINFMI